jgi:hypothetical protein
MRKASVKCLKKGKTTILSVSFKQTFSPSDFFNEIVNFVYIELANTKLKDLAPSLL